MNIDTGGIVAAAIGGVVAFVTNLIVTVYMFGRLQERADNNKEMLGKFETAVAVRNDKVDVRLGNAEQEISAFNMYMGTAQDRHRELLDSIKGLRQEVHHLRDKT